MPKARPISTPGQQPDHSAHGDAHIQRLQELQAASPGKPFIFNDDPLRSLYLNPDCMQSAMHLDAPERLICAYSQAMMGFLLWNPTPRHIILIGLGGGSLVKYCYRYLPDCRITVIEINADVIALRDHFFIPPDDERLSVIHADALSALPLTPFMSPDADVIIIDAFDQQGLVTALNTAAFYQSCYQRLRSGGILVSNIGGKPSILAPMLSHLRQLFAKEVCWIKSPDSYNLIVFAIKESFQRTEKINVAEALYQEHPELALALLPTIMHSIKPANDEDEQRLLLKDLRQLMVKDAHVPQSYAEWRAYILA